MTLCQSLHVDVTCGEHVKEMFPDAKPWNTATSYILTSETMAMSDTTRISSL